MNRVYLLDLKVFEEFPQPDNPQYFDIYKSFITECYNSRDNRYFQYSDFHHVMPVCLGGIDDLNRIFLTYREHYLAHYYLAKAYCFNYDLLFTINMMSGIGKYNAAEEYADKYSESRKLYTDHMRIKMSGEGNPMKNPDISSKFLGDNNPSKREDVREKLRQATQLNLEYIREASREARIGRIWVNNGIEMKHIYPDMLSAYLDKGYVRGMIPRKDSPSKEFDCICKICGKSYKGGKYSRLCPEHLKEVCSSKVYNK